MCLNWAFLPSRSELDPGLTFLEGPKLDHTHDFLKYIWSLPIHNNDEYSTTVEAVPAIVGVRFQKARAGMRVKFMDGEGNGVQLPKGTQIQFTVFDAPSSQ